MSSTSTPITSAVNVAPVSDEIQNTTFIDQRDDAIESSHLFGGEAPIKAQNKYVMPELYMSSIDILKKPILIDSFNWTVSSPLGTTLASYAVPEIISSLTSIHNLMFQTYAFFKPTIRLRFVMNTTKFHVGKLIVFSDPFRQMTESLDTRNINKQVNRWSATGNPNVQLDAGNSNTAIIDIPFEHIQSYLTTNSRETFDIMTIIRVLVLNPLAVQSGTTSSVNVQTFLQCVDLDLHVPIYVHPTTIPSLLSARSARLQEQGGALAKVASSGSAVVKGAQGAYGNAITGNFSGAADSAGSALAAASGILREFNLDHPSDGIQCTYNTISPCGPLAHGQGPDSSVRLSIAPLSGYTEHSSFSGSTPQEMSLRSLAQVKMLFDQITWPAAAIPNTILASYPVMPSLCHGEDFLSVAQNTNTFLSYISSYFAYWRGSISYRVDAAASQFHTGRLALVFIPNQDLTVPTGSNFTQNPLAVFDLHEHKTLTVNVPFQSSVARKLYCPWNSVGTRASLTDLHVLGYFHVVVLNSLASPASVVPDIQLNWYIGGGPDIDFFVPQHNPQEGFAALLPPESVKLEEQADVEPLPTRSNDDNDQDYMTKGSGQVARMNVFTENIDDVRDVARRYGLYRTAIALFTPLPAAGYPNASTYSAQIRLDITPLLITSPTDFSYGTAVTNVFGAQSANIPAAFFSRLYALWHGSMRFKILPRSSRIYGLTMIAHFEPTAGQFTDKTGEPVPPPNTYYSFPAHTTNISQSASLQVECPFYSPYNQLLVETVEPNFLPDTFTAGQLVIDFSVDSVAFMPLTTDTTPVPYMTFDVFAAIGDDFVFSYPVAPPFTYSTLEVVAPLP